MSAHTPRRPLALLLVGGAVTALVLAGCSSNGNTGTAGSKGSLGPATSSASSESFGPAAVGPHNGQDVAFVTDMLPHHAQAVEMASMALTRKADGRSWRSPGRSRPPRHERSPR